MLGATAAMVNLRTQGGSDVRATTRLKNMVSANRIVVAPGAFDGLSARLVEQAGFPADLCERRRDRARRPAYPTWA